MLVGTFIVIVISLVVAMFLVVIPAEFIFYERFGWGEWQSIVAGVVAWLALIGIILFIRKSFYWRRESLRDATEATKIAKETIAESDSRAVVEKARVAISIAEQVGWPFFWSKRELARKALDIAREAAHLAAAERERRKREEAERKYGRCCKCGEIRYSNNDLCCGIAGKWISDDGNAWHVSNIWFDFSNDGSFESTAFKEDFSVSRGTYSFDGGTLALKTSTMNVTVKARVSNDSLTITFPNGNQESYLRV